MLSVNIDHVATLRQARYRGGPHYGEPDIVQASFEAALGGADGVTVHLREDRRHVTDRDARLIRQVSPVRFNFEMAATEEMVKLAAELRPHSAMLVPEGRNEVTTEGGLDVAGKLAMLTGVVSRLRQAGCLVSAFIDADLRQVEAAHAAGFDVCELHTGPYAHAFYEAGGDYRNKALVAELEQLAIAGGEVRAAGMRCNAGHALNYLNVRAVAVLPGINELHIGHAIVSRSVFVGLREAVAEMARLCRPAAGTRAPGDEA
jgi:pyridoxine 5-phosphate synthase